MPGPAFVADLPRLRDGLGHPRGLQVRRAAGAASEEGHEGLYSILI